MLVKNEDIFTLILNGYGTLIECVQFLEDNPSVTNLNFDTTKLAGQQVYINPALTIPIQNAQPILKQPPAQPTSLNFLARQGQSIYDIALNTYGNLDNIVKLLTDNNLTFYSSFITNFVFDSTLINDTNVYNTTTGKGYYFSTGNPAQYRVYSNEDGTVVYTNEDGTIIYTPE